MVKSCCAINCSNRFVKGSSIKFYHFPSDPDRGQLWIAAVKRKQWEPNEYSRLCSEHFISGMKSDDKTHPDYVPTVFCHATDAIHHGKRKLERYKGTQAMKAKRRLRVNDEVVEPEIEPECESVQPHFTADNCQGCTELRNLLQQSAVVSSQSMQCVVEENIRLKEQIESLKLANSRYEKENLELQNEILSIMKKVEQSTSQECATLMEKNKKLLKDIEELQEKFVWSDIMLCNDDMVKFYTGLPNSSTFKLVVEYISEDLHIHHNAALSPSEEILLVLMKLRLNLEHKNLAYRFHISAGTVTIIFHKWLK